MKFLYKAGLGLVTISWLATGAVWYEQQQSERYGFGMSMRNHQFTPPGDMHGGFHGDWTVLTKAEHARAVYSITAQLNAFKKDNYSEAMRFQSSALRDQFREIETFRSTIRNNYPQFANYKNVWFGHGRIDPTGRHINLLVQVEGVDGEIVRAIYSLVYEDRLYRVDGVRGDAFMQQPLNDGNGNAGGTVTPPQPKPITDPSQDA